MTEDRSLTVHIYPIADTQVSINQVDVRVVDDNMTVCSAYTSTMDDIVKTLITLGGAARYRDVCFHHSSLVRLRSGG